MKLYLQKLVPVAALIFAFVSPALAQNYPKPGKDNQALVLCNGCTGKNASGEPNDKLPLWPYSDPLAKHVGRLVDSVTTRDIQQPFRTVRARKMLVAPTQRGTAPPRVYFQLGSAIGAYSFDKFFTTTIPGGMVDISTLYSVKRGSDPEKLIRWEGFIYPEYASSGWTTFFMDGQDRMFDLDFDDRGHVFAATGPFGWGITRDDGRTSGGHLPLVKQLVGESDPAGFGPSVIISIKTGNQYWAVTSGAEGRAVYDVTTPSSPMFRRKLTGSDNAIAAWAKSEETQRIAIVTGEGKIAIYDYDDFVKDGSPIETFTAGTGMIFADVTADDDGNFWAGQSTNKTPVQSNIYRFRVSGAGYVAEPFTAGSGGFATKKINFGGNYIVAVGTTPSGIEVRLYKLENNSPVQVDLGDFFTKHYHRAPPGYAQPPSTEVTTIFGAHVIKQNGKTYLVYNVGGLSDAFELQTGDSISASRRNGQFGTTNAYSKPTESGPFYGDILGFTSTDTNPLGDMFVEWNFANPEAGSENVREARTNVDVEHQFTGLTTTTAISTTKNVKVVSTADSDISSTVAVDLVVPTARIGIADSTSAATTTVVTADDTQLSLIFGDKLTDASDGTVEGHYSEWTIDATTTQALPNTPVDAGNYGPHTATLVAKYGKYDSAFATVGSPFIRRVQNLAYVVRPFAAEFKPAAKAGSTVTFKAAARKAASLTSIPSWDVSWTLKTEGGVDVLPALTTSVAFGTIPDFPVAVAIPDKSVLTLTVSVPANLLDASAADYASHSITQTLLVPDPKVTINGCVEAGKPCSFTLTSTNSNPISTWNISWAVKRGTTTVATSTANPFTPTNLDAGDYTVEVTASTGVFSTTTTPKAFEIAPPSCGNPPATSMISIATSCDNCAVGEEVTISPSVLGYNWQNCEEFEWNFGDGTATVTTTQFTHKKKYMTSGKKTIKLRIKKGTEYSGQVTYQINVGSIVEPPVCTIPFNITISYTGSKGCQTGNPCKVGELVTFTAKRGSTNLQSCDNVSWTQFDETTSHRMVYLEEGTYPVNVTVTNTAGSATATASIKINPDSNPGGGTCQAPATADQVYAEFEGQSSGCNDLNPTTVCTKSETIKFSARPFAGYTIQSCDTFEWDFGDGSAKKTGLDTTHAFTGDAASYRVKLRVFNSSNTTGNTMTIDVPFSNVAAKPLPVLSFSSFPTSGALNNEVLFVVNSNIPATGWNWDFGDGKKDTTQASVVGTTTSIRHTYTSKGDFVVVVKARNAEDSTSAQSNSATGTIKIDDVPEFRYLLPVVSHGPGQGGSVWRTDVQIYNPDPNVSPTNTLDMTATLNGVSTQLHIAHSTYIYEDFMQRLTTADLSGPVIITTKAKYAPQIWTRTYNQAENGTFGQFIPAIRLDAAGGGSAVGTGRYFLAGLRNDARYRTNIGLVNPTPQSLTATISAFDETGLPIPGGTFTRTLTGYQLDQFPIGSVIQNFPADHPFSLEIETGAGQWVIAYASFIDGGSNDPVFLQAIRESELVSEDYRTLVIPGVGHVGAWRSDVAIYNSNGRGITVDMAYHDQTGNKVGEATNVPIGGGEFLLYGDLLKQGVLGGNVPDGLGMLRITVPPAVSTERFPMAYARTYNDNGSGKTYGQGIPGFAAARPNVSTTHAGLIPAVRSKAGQYYTNVFVTNVTGAPVDFSITVLDPATGAVVRQDVARVEAYQSFAATSFNIGEGREMASLKIAATGSVWAYASIVDARTFDPEYVPAVPIAP